MYNNYNYYPQQTQSQQPLQTTPTAMSYLRQPVSLGLKGRPVSSLEEARASSIDFDGSISYFPDVANRRIYTKQINMDGTSTFNMYELKEIPLENLVNMNSSNYVTKEELEAALQQFKATLAAPQPIAETAPPQKQEVRPF